MCIECLFTRERHSLSSPNRSLWFRCLLTATWGRSAIFSFNLNHWQSGRFHNWEISHTYIIRRAIIKYNKEWKAIYSSLCQRIIRNYLKYLKIFLCHFVSMSSLNLSWLFIKGLFIWIRVCFTCKENGWIFVFSFVHLLRIWCPSENFSFLYFLFINLTISRERNFQYCVTSTFL